MNESNQDISEVLKPELRDPNPSIQDIYTHLTFMKNAIHILSERIRYLEEEVVRPKCDLDAAGREIFAEGLE